MSVKIDFAVNLLSLSKNSLNQLGDFAHEFKDFLEHIDCRKSLFKSDFFDLFDVYEFIDYAGYKTGVSKVKSNTKLYRRCNYNFFVKKYKDMFCEILKNDCMFLEIYFEFFKKEFCEYIDLIEYFKSNYDMKEDILLKLKLIADNCGISKISFVPVGSLDGKYSVGFTLNRHLSKGDRFVYFVKDMICSDGKRIWGNQLEEDIYNVSLKDAKYLIKYTKGSRSVDKISMSVCSFDFDIKTLPNYEELTDITVIPNIDFEVVRKKTSAVNLNYFSIMAMDKAYDLQILNSKMNDELKKVSHGMEHLNFLEANVNGEAYLECVNAIREEVIDEFIDEGVLTRSELGELTNSKKELEENKTFYYSRKRKRRF